MVNILLADDHNIVRNGIRMLLETEANFNIVAETVNSKEALMALKAEVKIDIVLTEMHISENNATSVITALTQLDENVNVVVLSMHSHEKYVMQAFLEGAKGYLLKSISPEELIFALNFIHQGGKYLSSELSMTMLHKILSSKRFHHQTEIGFSLREIEVLNLIASGLTNSEISEKLFISKRTVEGHRQSLIDKTQVKNTAALIRFAVLNGIIN